LVAVADFGGGPAEDLLEQPEGVLEVETAQERRPGAVPSSGPSAVAEDRSQIGWGFAVTGQVIDGQPDYQ